MDFKEYIAKLMNKKVDVNQTPYEKFDKVEDLEGKSIKSFVRCYGYSLLELFNNKMSNENSHYVTCVDEIFDNNLTLLGCLKALYKFRLINHQNPKHYFV